MTERGVGSNIVSAGLADEQCGVGDARCAYGGNNE